MKRFSVHRVEIIDFRCTSKIRFARNYWLDLQRHALGIVPVVVIEQNENVCVRCGNHAVQLGAQGLLVVIVEHK